MNDTPIAVEIIAAAERLAGLEYTAAERALMAEGLVGQVAAAQARRAVALPADLGPAQKFDPRLPGFIMPPETKFSVAQDASPLPEAEEDIAFASVAQLAGWIRRGALTSRRLTEIYLRRIERLNDQLFCFVIVMGDAALARADELDAMTARSKTLGPLHGIPYGMKDIIDTAGVETAWGAEPYRGRVPKDDAFITQLLHRAGAVMLGKTSVGALAYGDLWYGGRTRNPWNLNEGASGSSAGSASAVAAGLAAFAVGTETLGSIVSPATRCGAVGLRPSFGRVSRRGAMALCWSLDKIGPICRAVEDTALVLKILNEPDAADGFQIPASFSYQSNTDISSLRIGYYPADFEHEDALELDAKMLAVTRGLGAEMVPLTRPPLPYDSLMGIVFAEAAAQFEDLTLTGRDDELRWQEADAWPNQFRMARFLSAVDHVQLDRLRRLVMQQMDAVFKTVDVIIGPSLAGPMMVITNFTGHPCLCLPAGFFETPARDPISLVKNQGVSGGELALVPHSVCLWGRLFEEGTMLSVAKALEAQLAPGGRRPPL